MAIDPWTAIGGGTLGALITGLFAARRLAAEARKYDSDAFTTVIERAARTVIDDLRMQVERQQGELKAQRDNRVIERQIAERERLEAAQLIADLEHRVAKLEFWIAGNTDQDPADINGWPI